MSTGHECTSRDEAGHHYAGLLAAGATLQLADLRRAGHDGEGERLLAQPHMQAPDPDAPRPQLTVRLTCAAT